MEEGMEIHNNKYVQAKLRANTALTYNNPQKISEDLRDKEINEPHAIQLIEISRHYTPSWKNIGFKGRGPSWPEQCRPSTNKTDCCFLLGLLTKVCQPIPSNRSLSLFLHTYYDKAWMVPHTELISYAREVWSSSIKTIVQILLNTIKVYKRDLSFAQWSLN